MITERTIVQVQCDGCNARLLDRDANADFESAEQATSKVYGLGWFIRQVNGERKHLCPKCEAVISRWVGASDQGDLNPDDATTVPAHTDESNEPGEHEPGARKKRHPR
jgi:predicted RNA-binding Zn-ribbon protein involved in translation (DUF1610 family)